MEDVSRSDSRHLPDRRRLPPFFRTESPVSSLTIPTYPDAETDRTDISHTPADMFHPETFGPKMTAFVEGDDFPCWKKDDSACRNQQ